MSSGRTSSTPSTGSAAGSTKPTQTGQRSGHRVPGLPVGAGSRRTARRIDERFQGGRLVDLDDHRLRPEVESGFQTEPPGVRRDRFVDVSVDRLEKQLDKSSRDIGVTCSFAAELQADAFATGTVDIREALARFEIHPDHQESNVRPRRCVGGVWAGRESECPQNNGPSSQVSSPGSKPVSMARRYRTTAAEIGLHTALFGDAGHDAFRLAGVKPGVSRRRRRPPGARAAPRGRAAGGAAAPSGPLR